MLDVLHKLLNVYGQSYFIVIKGLPPCLFPQAHERIVYARQKGKIYRRIPSCGQCRLKRQCPGWSHDLNLPQEDIQSIADIPSEIVLEITGRCNLSCGHCTSAIQTVRQVPLRTIKTILNQAHRCRVPAVRFTGGEPLLHPDLAEILSYAKARGFYVLLNTNATLLTPSFLRLFSRSVDNVLVSLQGFDSASDQALTHSAVSFERKLQNIFLLQSYVPTMRLGTVITPLLLEHWPRYAALMKRIKPSAWELFRPMSGSARQEPPLTRKDYRELSLRVLSLKKEGINVKLANALPFCVLSNLRLSAALMLGALSDDGNSRLVWDVRGFFKPSYFIDKNLGKSVMPAWRHLFLKKLKSSAYLPKRCQECEYWSWCRGGSRAIALQGNHSFFAADPLFD
ncbi:MAG: radical SAM protein [Candidatus Omnitrophica bacterium]|nr:radical SAM protein [Candidatus Omnitrophota bacterium]